MAFHSTHKHQVLVLFAALVLVSSGCHLLLSFFDTAQASLEWWVPEAMRSIQAKSMVEDQPVVDLSPPTFYTEPLFSSLFLPLRLWTHALPEQSDDALEANRDQLDKWDQAATLAIDGVPLEPLNVTLHVFAWRRKASLKRLLESVQFADYGHYRPIPLVFHIDGGALEEVVQVVNGFKWEYGPVTIIERQEQLGLKQTMKAAWNPSGKESDYGIFLEDDVSLSPLFFQYTAWCIRHFLSKAAPYYQPGLMGCSLYTPRTDEISPVEDPQFPPPWTPTMHFNDTLFYFQVPCSWGSVVSSAHWASFVKYLDTRWTLPDEDFWLVPSIRSNTWQQSWKRYLIEYMYLKGWYMLYPSFLREASLSTNHYEEGVHSVPEGMQVRVPDTLRADPDERFTVPLLSLSDQLRVEALLKRQVERGLGDLPVVNLLHQVVGRGTQGLGVLQSQALSHLKDMERQRPVAYQEWIALP